LKALQGFAWLLVLQSIGEVLARGFKLPFPGPVVGLMLLLVALGWAPLRESVAGAAQFLLTHLSLLFVPVGVGVMTHLGLLSQYGLRLVVVVVVSTWISLAVTALVLRALMPRSADTPTAAPTNPDPGAPQP